MAEILSGGLAFFKWSPSRSDISYSIRALPEWSERFEVPDVVGFGDFVLAADEVAKRYRSQATQPDPLGFFLYPKGNGGFRRLCIPSVKDIVLTRAAVGYTAIACERALSEMPVYSARLARGVPDWRFRAEPYSRFRKDAARSAKRWSCELMVRTDVKDYYPSIPVGQLAQDLMRMGCRYGPTAFFLERVLHWQRYSGLRGLPVGPESSHVPGTVFLKPVDVAMMRATDGYFRYTDDIVYFVADRRAGDLLDKLDENLAERGLRRGIDKTEVHHDPAAALEAIERRLFASLSNGLSSGSPLAMGAVKREFVHDVVEGLGNVRDFRWYIRVFLNRGDAFAMRWLTEDWTRFNIDPRVSADYMSRCGLADSEVVGRAIDMLGMPSNTEMAGVDLHLLRVFRQLSMGVEEMRTFERVANDVTRPSQVRCWAWSAASNSAGFDVEAAVEAAAEEGDPAIRRGIVLSMRGKSSRSRKWALRDIARKHPETAPACAWALAA